MWIIIAASLLSGSVSAMTDAEMKSEFMKVSMSCMKDYDVEMSDLLKLKSHVLPNKNEVKCLLACTYRKLGSLNDAGNFDLDKLHKIAEKSKEGDEQGIENGKKLADVCIKVNDANVTDGNKGCERAGLMFECIVGNAHKFGFTV